MVEQQSFKLHQCTCTLAGLPDFFLKCPYGNLRVGKRTSCRKAYPKRRQNGQPPRLHSSIFLIQRPQLHALIFPVVVAAPGDEQTPILCDFRQTFAATHGIFGVKTLQPPEAVPHQLLQHLPELLFPNLLLTRSSQWVRPDRDTAGGQDCLNRYFGRDAAVVGGAAVEGVRDGCLHIRSKTVPNHQVAEMWLPNAGHFA